MMFQSCHVFRKTEEPKVKEPRNTREDRSAPDLQQLIRENAFKAGTISAKASVKTEGGQQEGSFNITLRLQTDTMIWISISPMLGIEVARILATRDSVKFMDRLNNKYALADYQFLSQMLDVNVSSMGNSKSLKGGTLIATPLRGADGEIYALAQGNLVVGGAGASAGGSKVQINHLSAGRIPQGAQVERSVPTPLHEGDSITLGLNASDFQTARRVADAINARMGAGRATALDGRTVQVQAPTTPGARVNFIAELEELPLETMTPSAKVVINARTGSVVLNQAVTLGPCAVAHGNLSITINSTPVISQPNPLSQGQTVVTQKSDITINQEPGNIIQMPPSTQLADVVRALNALGATPQDLLAILQAIKAAGALNAELEVI